MEKLHRPSLTSPCDAGGTSTLSNTRSNSIQSLSSTTSSNYQEDIYSDPSAWTPLTSRSELFDDDNTADEDVLSDKYIAVVGGLGYIGSHTSLELVKAGYNVLIIDNLSNAFATVFDRIRLLASEYREAQCQQMPQMRFEQADYTDQNAMKEILDKYVVHSPFGGSERSSLIDGVIHFAAYKSVGESISSPIKYYANNVAGLIGFLAILNEYNVKKFIFSSSATVYGALANSGLPLKEEYVVHHPESFIDHDGTEKTSLPGCTGLTNPYGRTKWMCEAILADLAFANPEWTILALRYFNPVSCEPSGVLKEDPRNEPTNLMPIVVNVLKGKSPVLDIFGMDYPTWDGSAVRDYIHVVDLARGHVAAYRTARERQHQIGFRAYNLGSGSGNSVLEIVQAMEAASNKKIPVSMRERRSGDVGTCVAVPTRAHTELNWKTEKEIHECCKDIINSL
jgi:UDP-glucose 4-epimerase